MYYCVHWPLSPGNPGNPGEPGSPAFPGKPTGPGSPSFPEDKKKKLFYFSNIYIYIFKLH